MNMEDKVRLEVEIFGTTYKMVGNFTEKYMLQISAYVNEIMDSIARSNPRLDSQKVAVLALIHVADEFFQLKGKWDSIEQERLQLNRQIEDLRKAFELTEEKERGASNEVRYLKEQISALERENTRIAEESELASLTWAERVEELEFKYKESQTAAVAKAAEAAALEERVRELEEARREQEEQEAAVILREPADIAPKAAVTGDAPAVFGRFSDKELMLDVENEDQATLIERYKKLQEEYVKLQNEFNEWIQLTLSETQ